MVTPLCDNSPQTHVASEPAEYTMHIGDPSMQGGHGMYAQAVLLYLWFWCFVIVRINNIYDGDCTVPVLLNQELLNISHRRRWRRREDDLLMEGVTKIHWRNTTQQTT
jgi:hypothetical protein